MTSDWPANDREGDAEAGEFVAIGERESRALLGTSAAGELGRRRRNQVKFYVSDEEFEMMEAALRASGAKTWRRLVLNVLGGRRTPSVDLRAVARLSSVIGALDAAPRSLRELSRRLLEVRDELANRHVEEGVGSLIAEIQRTVARVEAAALEATARGNLPRAQVAEILTEVQRSVGPRGRKPAT